MAGTNNGRSPQLAGYYAFWEQAVFNALAVMLLRGLDRLHSILGPSAKQPLFRVSRPRNSAQRPSCSVLHVLAVQAARVSLGEFSPASVPAEALFASSMQHA